MIEIINQNILEFNTDNKYHAVISDPPYGLAFMGKGWDSFKRPIDYQKWVTEWSTRLLDYLYPGAICAFFGGTRTYHRLATGLEDSGYEIFDSMIWCYGSGFPKSYNISKGIDKSLGLERSKIRYNPRPESSGTMSGHMDTRKWIEESRINGYHEVDDNNPVSDLGQQWQGYGTALKPAYEPIVLCRKPLEKGGYVNSVLKYGTSGLNIDGGRIGASNQDDYGRQAANSNGVKNSHNGFEGKSFKIHERNGEYKSDLGRFPANFGLICDCEKEPCECIEQELDNQSGLLTSGSLKSGHRQTNFHDNTNGFRKDSNNQSTKRKSRNVELKSNSGGASRFFYTAKASSKERDIGLDNFELVKAGGMQARNDGSLDGHITYRKNNHPTVKPIKLIEYLAKLLLPPIDNSSILIPFSGVGSEMIGANLVGWSNITGVEVDENYVTIANKRLDYWTQFDSYENAMKNKLILDKQLELL